MDIIDWSQVNWIDVSVYAAMVLVASIIGMAINKALGDTLIFAGILTTILFSAGYVAWNYYPHGIDVGQTHVAGQAMSTAPASTLESQPVQVPAADPAAAVSEPSAEPTSESTSEPAPANQ